MREQNDMSEKLIIDHFVSYNYSSILIWKIFEAPTELEVIHYQFIASTENATILLHSNEIRI